MGDDGQAYVDGMRFIQIYFGLPLAMVILCVTLVPGQALDLAGATSWLADNGVAKMRWPERLEIMSDMPMTPTRKIMKGALAKRIAPRD